MILFENHEKKLHNVAPSYFATNHVSSEVFGSAKWNALQHKTNGVDESVCKERLQDALEQSMSSLLCPNSAMLLSGGLDSSILLAMAKKLGHTFSTYSLRYECQCAGAEMKNEDSMIAKRFADELGCFHEVISISGEQALESMADIVKCFNEPFAGGVSLYWMLKHIPEQVVFTGDGADELFMGYPLHQMAYYVEQGVRLLKEQGVVSEDFLQNAPFEPQHLHAMIIDAKDNPYTVLVKHLNLDDGLLKMLVNEEYLDGKMSIAEYTKMLWTQDVGRLTGASLQYYLSDPLPNQIQKYISAFSNRWNKEIRTPFLTESLMTCAMSIPTKLKIKDGIPKYILREVAKEWLPAYVWNRKKETFVPPVLTWMQAEWKEFLLDTFSMDKLMSDSVLNPAGVYYLLKRFYENPEKEFQAGQILYNLLMFQLWWQEQK